MRWRDARRAHGCPLCGVEISAKRSVEAGPCLRVSDVTGCQPAREPVQQATVFNPIPGLPSGFHLLPVAGRELGDSLMF